MRAQRGRSQHGRDGRSPRAGAHHARRGRSAGGGDGPPRPNWKCGRNAEFGKPVLIYPNLYLVRVPLPHNPLHALNSYFILDDDGTTTIVDVGFNHPDCEQALSDALAALGRSWDKVQVVLTHSHPDHTGNLDRIWREGMPVLANLHSFQEVKNLMEMEGNVYGPLLLQAATSEQQQDMTFGEEGPRLHVSAELLASFSRW